MIDARWADRNLWRITLTNDTRDFKKEYQERLADLFGKLDAEILHVPGGHVGFIVQSAYYIDLMEKFLEKNGIWQISSGLRR